MTSLLSAFIILLFGLCIGSFLNVCIYRLPLLKSIVFPGSICPYCDRKIRFYDNIPVISYIFLRGKCRFCSAPIAVRYPMVEIMSGLIAVGIFLRYGVAVEGIIYFVFVSILLVITFIDIDHQVIPDIITLPGIPLCLFASFALPSLKFIDSILGLLFGGGSLLAVAWLYALIAKKEGMGGGDIKLLAMIGAILGWKGVLFTVFISSATGSIVGIIVMLRMKKNMKLAIPFGPFLSIGAMAYIFFGPELIEWYFRIWH